MKNTRMMGWLTLGAFLWGCGGPLEEQSGIQEPEAGANEVSLVGPLPYRGINLSSAEFGSAIPGTHGKDYVYPDPAYANYTTADYYITKGMTTFRLPFRWERLQRTRNAAFDAAELSRLKTTVNRLTDKGATVILDPHNYARYNGALIGSGIPNADFADFWTRLANEFKGNTKVVFGLMNEPHGMPTEQWLAAANAAIQAIRNTGATQLILVPGNAWTGAHSWASNWYGTPNATVMLQVKDPRNNYAFEVHQYLDSDS
ncbi:MAG TPA: glycoside hydrolase family 5 protein, partial [Cystobacter sp.]